MNPWVRNTIVILLACAFVPLIVNGVAALVTKGVNSVGHGIQSLLNPLSMSGDARMEGLVHLCLYLVAIVLLAKFLSRN